jgi:hypothetical protein
LAYFRPLSSLFPPPPAALPDRNEPTTTTTTTTTPAGTTAAASRQTTGTTTTTTPPPPLKNPASKVCVVTGASGYVASMLVKMLCEAGHGVRGTVRSLTDKDKVDHLKGLCSFNPPTLYEADLMIPGTSLCLPSAVRPRLFACLN